MTGPGGASHLLPIGDRSTSAFVSAPRDASAALFVLAHGAGGSLEDPLLLDVHRALALAGHGVIRFNFLYRDRGAKLPDKTPLLEATWRAVLAWARERFPEHGARLVIGGKSMGGRMASHLAAAGDSVSGLFLLGYPLHPAKQPEKLRDAHLASIPVRSFFAQGSKDALCDLALMRPAVAKMGALAQLFVIEGADHSLALPKKAGISAADLNSNIVAEACRWLLPQ